MRMRRFDGICRERGMPEPHIETLRTVISRSPVFYISRLRKKILKAFLYLKGERPVIGHATLKLSQRCVKYDSRFQEAQDSCRELDIFYLPTRYPNGIPGGVPYEYFNSIHAEKAAQAYENVYTIIKEFFKPITNQ